MSHDFAPDVVIPGTDEGIDLLGTWPEFATIMTAGSSPATDCRSPDRVRLPGQGRRPDKILAALRERRWHRRNTGLAQLDGGLVVNGGLMTAAGRPVMGVSQNHWEKKHAAPDRSRRPVDAPRHLDGSVALLPFCRSARYDNYFHFITEFLALAPACLSLQDRHGIDRIVVTVERPPAGGFHDGLLRRVFGSRYEDLEFVSEPFTADRIAFGVDRCGIYARDDQAGLVRWQVPEGMGMTFMSLGLGAAFQAMQPPAPPQGEAPILIVSRDRAPARRIVNEAALVEALSPWGARKVYLEDHPMADQIRMVSGARVLIGCHGAGMVNAGFLRPGSCAVELTGRQYLPRAFDFAGLSGLCDIAYHTVLCDEDGDFTKDNRLVGNVGNDISLTSDAIETIAAICRPTQSEGRETGPV